MREEGWGVDNTTDEGFFFFFFILNLQFLNSSSMEQTSGGKTPTMCQGRIAAVHFYIFIDINTIMRKYLELHNLPAICKI